jgi:hypothetical protein
MDEEMTRRIVFTVALDVDVEALEKSALAEGGDLDSFLIRELSFRVKQLDAVHRVVVTRSASDLRMR